MNRIIKFRAWEVKRKAMSQVGSIDWDDDRIITAHLWNVIDGARKVYVSKEFADDVEFMQYTGLKDKNGVDQFESDLVKRDGHNGEIRWDELEARFRIYCDNAKPIPCNYPVDSSWEVIGNKYENEGK